MRPVIPFLLLAALAIAGCDRQSPPQSQANEASASDGESPDSNETVEREEIGTLVREHAGEAAPAITFKDPANATASLANFRGKPLLLNLWATWCAPCIKEMPTLDALAESLGDSVTVLVVAQETDRTVANVDPFFQKSAFKRLQPYIDGESQLSLSMGENLPVTILYDSSGKEVWRMRGSMDWTGKMARELIAEAK